MLLLSNSLYYANFYRHYVRYDKQKNGKWYKMNIIVTLILTSLLLVAPWFFSWSSHVFDSWSSICFNFSSLSCIATSLSFKIPSLLSKALVRSFNFLSFSTTFALFLNMEKKEISLMQQAALTLPFLCRTFQKILHYNKSTVEHILLYTEITLKYFWGEGNKKRKIPIWKELFIENGDHHTVFSQNKNYLYCFIFQNSCFYSLKTAIVVGEKYG